MTAEEEAKAQKALETRNGEREQNKLRMRRVRGHKGPQKKQRKLPLRLADLATLICYTSLNQLSKFISLYCADTARKRMDLYDTLKVVGRILQWNGLID